MVWKELSNKAIFSWLSTVIKNCFSFCLGLGLVKKTRATFSTNQI